MCVCIFLDSGPCGMRTVLGGSPASSVSEHILNTLVQAPVSRSQDAAALREGKREPDLMLQWHSVQSLHCAVSNLVCTTTLALSQ